MSLAKKDHQMEAVIQQVLDLMELSGDTTQELSEDQLDLVVAAVSDPDYQNFIREILEGGKKHGTETNRRR